MRIEAYTQVQQVYNTKKATTAQRTDKKSGSDQLQISNLGRDIQTAQNAVAAADDVRTELTAPLKASIENGTYQVSGESFAEKLMQKYEEYGNL
jgi:negative regulator of flagellin synthesis FlgM